MLKGRAIAFLLLFPSALCAAALSPEGYAAALAGFGPRVEGSGSEAAAFEYLESSLRGMGLPVTVQDFGDAFEDYSRSRIVEAVVEGGREDELAIVVPVDSWIDSPDGTEGAYGLGLALGEAARLAEGRKNGVKAPITLRFVFLGAEKRGKRSEGGIAALGSKTWIARQEGRGRLAVLYLDAPFPGARIGLKSAGKGALSPHWYYEGMRRALEASGADCEIEANRQEAYRLGLANDFGPAAPYLEAGIPAIELRGADEAEIVPAAASAWFSQAIDRFAEGRAAGFSDSWDRHYFIVKLGRFVGVVGEKNYVAILVALAALVALSILAATVARRKAIKSLLKLLPVFATQFLALLLALVLTAFACRGLAALEEAILGSARAWTLMPRVFVAARILFCFLLFLATISQLAERRILTSNPYFYEFAGLVCLAIDVLVFSVVDLSASFYFIWALVVVEASLAVRRLWSSILAYAVMYFPLLVIAWELLRRPDLPAYGRLVAPDLVGVLAFSALALPFFVFTASPLLFTALPRPSSRRKSVVILAILALTAELAALVCFRVAVPGMGPRRKDLSVAESIDQDQGRLELRLSAAQRLGRGSLERGGTGFGYDSQGDRVVLGGTDRKKRIAIAESRSGFLDRVDEEIRVSCATPPYSLEFTLVSEDDILLYDCSLPYKVSVDGKSATIYAGVNPGRDLSFVLTVPEAFKAQLVAKASYLDPLEPLSQSSGSPLAFSGLTVTASFPIGAGAADRGSGDSGP